MSLWNQFSTKNGKHFGGADFARDSPTADVCRQGRNGVDCVGWLQTRLQVGGFKPNWRSCVFSLMLKLYITDLPVLILTHLLGWAKYHGYLTSLYHVRRVEFHLPKYVATSRFSPQSTILSSAFNWIYLKLFNFVTFICYFISLFLVRP